MNIRHQKLIIKDKYIQIYLNQPYWGAAQRYNWQHQIEGIGIAKEAILKAKELKKKIRIVMGKYGLYEISPDKAILIGEKYPFVARDYKVLYVIPRTEFKKVKPEEENKPKDDREAYYQMMTRACRG